MNHVEQVTEPTVRWLKLCSDSCQTVNQEVARFARDRGQRNLDAVYDLSTGLVDPTRLFEVQGRWMSQAVTDYTGQTQRMAALWSDLIRGATEQQAATGGQVVKPFADRMAAAGQKK